MNEKPKWMHYALPARRELNRAIDRHPKRPGHLYHSTLIRSYRRACEEFGYAGSQGDWEYLLRKAKLPGDETR